VTPIQELWLAAREEIIPAGMTCTKSQELELRRVFFLGALCLWQAEQGFKDVPPQMLADFQHALQVELAMFQATVGTPLEGMA
jgi:hypothetical protein